MRLERKRQRGKPWQKEVSGKGAVDRYAIEQPRRPDASACARKERERDLCSFAMSPLF